MKTMIIDTGTNKTLKEILASMSNNTICYIQYISNLSEAEKNKLVDKGFSLYTNIEILKLNEWAERIVLTSVKGNKLGFWSGNKNDDILTDMRVI